LKNINPDFLKVQKETEEEFEAIAKKLFNEYVIQNNDSIYRLTEIEFYWTSPTHIDPSVYPRTHTDPANGTWYFHYSGVDIALKNQELKGYGGILIRGIYDLISKKPYIGPMVSAMKLFSGSYAFQDFQPIKVTAHELDKLEVNKGPRKGLVKNAVEGGTDELNYRFWIKP
jgi:hypothetical protein